jgi:CHASE2 domain-containing sensor protein
MGIGFFLVRLLPDLFTRLEIATFDLRYRRAMSSGPVPTIEDIVIVDIDSRSLSKLGRFQNWPRSHHAELIDVLSADSARAVFVDLLLVERDADAQQDLRLVESIKRAGNVYLPVLFSPADSLNFLYVMDEDPVAAVLPGAGWEREQPLMGLPSIDRVEGPFAELMGASAGVGAVNLEVGGDNVIRRFPMVHHFLDRLYPTVALRMAADLLIQDGREPRWLEHGGIVMDEVTVPTDAAGRLWLNYAGLWKSFRYVSYYDVLYGRLPSGFFNGKVVMVGASAPGLADLAATPFQQGYPRVEVHATLLHNLMTGHFLQRTSNTVNVLCVLGFTLLGVVAALLLPLLPGLLILSLATGGLWLLAAALFTEQRLWITLVQPVGIGFQAFLLASIYRYWNETRRPAPMASSVEPRPHRPRLEVQHHHIDRWRPEDFVAASPAMQAVLARICELQQTEGRTLVSGEVGTGKELVARAIHSGSDRAQQAFVVVRCAGLPFDVESIAQRTEALSILFGHVKGAFAGANEDRLGVVQRARGGILFLDEVGQLSLPLQAHLLRVLTEGSVRRSGATESEPVDVRAMAASSEDLQRLARDGEFSQGLCDYLAQHQLSLPPLRDRREDIALLAMQISQDTCSELGLAPAALSEQVVQLLQSHRFPGNVRQLQRNLEQALRAGSGRVTPDNLSLSAQDRL